MTLTVNGEPRQSAAATVIALLTEEGVQPDAKGVAVALNGAVVRKPDWSATALADGDAVEIVKPFSGG
ncbi:MAG: sulfur carrier protein ThiS [Alphaproteobacteria bacterium]|nr:sulfur carrier protein ThiS [Alphaproteobacteria bacterium]MCB9930109.1 sulfur carrier protein ThiS [Alphaproteobacteria bacterium]